jgi:bifunctional non-homologous end joining protein LigD
MRWVDEVAWIKLKTHREQEFVIGGYSDPTGGRQHFGALLLGYYESRKLRFCGKVGTGFNESTLRSLNKVSKTGKRRMSVWQIFRIKEWTIRKRNHAGRNETLSLVEARTDLRGPILRVTDDSKLRQPVYVGLRG